MEQSNKARSALASQWEKLTSHFQSAFGPPIKLMQGLTWVLEKVNTGLDWLVNGLNSVDDEVTSWVGAIGIVVGSIAGFIKTIKFVDTALSVLPDKWFTGLRSVVSKLSSIGEFITTGFKSVVSLLVKGLGSVGEFIAGGFRSLFGGLSKGVGFIGELFGTFGGIALRFIGIIGWLVTAFEVGYKVGTYIYEMVKDFQWFNTMMTTIFKGLDHVLQYIPGSVGSDARERIAASDKASATTIDAKKSTEISIPKSPAASTIDSPSAKSVPSPSTGSSPVNTVDNTQVAPAKDKSADSNDINSMMASHNSLLEQLLVAMHNSVSVNKDILRYTKNQA